MLKRSQARFDFQGAEAAFLLLSEESVTKRVACCCRNLLSECCFYALEVRPGPTFIIEQIWSPQGAGNCISAAK